MVQIIMMMTFGKSIYYDFCVFNSWSYIFIFLMVCCTSMSQVTHLRFDLSTFFLSMQCSFRQSLPFNRSVMSDSLQPQWTAACQAFLSFTISWSLLKLISIESVKPSSHLILCRPLLLLPSIFLSFRVFSYESVLPIMQPKYWSFSFSISSSNEYSGLISFRIDWLNLLAMQGTVKSLLQHHNSKISIIQHSAFFMVQLSHPYMITGKIIPLTRWAFVSMSLLFNMLTRLVIAFLPSIKHLSISWMQT